MHGLPGVDPEGDPAVVKRVGVHRSVVRVCKDWLPRLQLLSFLIGFGLVLLPAIVPSWRAITGAIPGAAFFYSSYALLSPWSVAHLSILSAAFSLDACFRHHTPGGAVPVLTYREIEEMELFPRTKKGEVGFYISAINAMLVSTIWLLFPFGVLAFLVTRGGA